LDEGADSSARNKMRFDAKLPHNNKSSTGDAGAASFLADCISADRNTPWRSFRSANRIVELIALKAAGHLVQRGFVKGIFLIASRNFWLACGLIRPSALFINLLV
jgi:hypothetical protein